MRPLSTARTLATAIVASIAVAAGGSAALADDVANALDGSVDTAVEVLELAPGASGGTVLRVIPANNDGKQGCNLTQQSTMTARVTSSNLAAATVSPTSVTFSNCNDGKTLTVVAGTSGTARISLVETANTTGGTFNLLPATFSVTVAAPVQTATVTTVTCTDVTYDGSPQTPCTGSTSGQSGFSAAPTYSYEANTGAGTARVTATFTGDATHLPSSATATFTIAKAPSATTVTCPAGVTYTGAPVEDCTAAATGVALSPVPLTVRYAGNTDAGTAAASASWDGDANHAGSDGSQTFTIGQAAATCTVTPYSEVYDGAAHGVSGTCTGVTGADLTDGLSLGATRTDAGSTEVTWTFEGGLNHADQSGTSSVTIARAPSSVSVTCPATGQTYTGSAITPCSATVTGVGGLSDDVPVGYTGNTGVGTAGASATFDGGANWTTGTGSSTFEIVKAPTTTTVVCAAGPHVYTGSSITPCSATVTGGSLGEVTAEVEYSGNVNAGTASGQATYDGDANRWSSSGSATFTIGRAPSTVTVTCTEPQTYTGAALEPCSAVAEGVALEPIGLTEVVYTANVGAGTAEATASWGGDANHDGSTATKAFTIAKAPSTVTVTCDPSTVTFDGSAQTPCTARATGAGNLDTAVDVSYAKNTGAGTAEAGATYEGGPNHVGDTGSATFVIARAGSVTVLDCPASVTYTGSALTPCTAEVTGVDGLREDVDVDHTDNVDAGTAHASASYAGGDNHLASSDEEDFTIARAPSTVTITCVAGLVYTGLPQTPCTAEATGAGGLREDVPVTYRGNTDAGTATASASYGGDANHDGDDATAQFSIAKAASTVSLICDTSRTYTGSPIEACSASVSGAGMPAAALPVSYSDNTVAGAARAGASYAGDANHEPSSAAGGFTITKAPSAVTVTCAPGPYVFTGSPVTPGCTARASGAGGLDAAVVPVTFASNTAVGTATASATYGGDDNHLGSTGSTTFQISAWTLKGFYQPVDMNNVLNTVKNGSTVPFKFEVFSGTTELTSTSAVTSFTSTKIACPGTTSEDLIEEFTTTGATTLRYDAAAGQFVQNWQTPKLVNTCHRVTMTTQDGSTLTAYFKLK